MKEYKIWLSKLLTILIIIFVVLPLIAAVFGLLSKAATGPRVAVVELLGVIEDSSEVIEALYKASLDDDAKAVVLRIDSPGGAVAPSQEIYEAVKKLKAKKPIVASMGSVAASGGLYSSLGASKIFASKGTQTGSIGVIMQLPNYQVAADKVGISMVTVKSGALKDTGNPFRNMTDDERTYLEETSKNVHGDFIQAVSEGRGLTIEKTKSFADGRVILGSQAKELGLIDEFGDIFDAATQALKLAKVEVKSDKLPELEFVNRKRSALQALLKGFADLPQTLRSWVSGDALIEPLPSPLKVTTHHSLRLELM